MSANKNVVVFGATGKQGRAVTEWLSKSGLFNIYAVTRDNSSAKAIPLGKLTNVQLVAGDASNAFEVLATIAKIGTVDGVFFAPVGPDAEVHIGEGHSVADAAVQYGVKHLVFSSTDFSGHRNTDTGIPAIEAKKQIEDSLLALSSSHPNLQVTILRPVGFLENLFFPGYADAIPRMWPSQLLKSGIATTDIGRAVSEIFASPDRFLGDGRIVALSGYQGRPEEWMTTWEDVTGEDLRKREFKPSGGMSEDKLRLLKFINFNESDARVLKTKQLFPWVTDLKAFLKQSRA